MNTIRVSNCLDLDQNRHFVGPDPVPKCLQKLSADLVPKCLLIIGRLQKSPLKEKS